MDGEISVGMGELEVTDDKEAVLATFVGSCVALCLYDPQAKVGGMAHIMLPDSSKDASGRGNAAKYADEALENTIGAMAEKGAQAGRLVAKIAGGAKIFAHEGSEDMFAIGTRNAESLRKLLQKRGIRIAGEDVGQTYGRWVRFNISSGQVKVGKRGREEKVL
ncbi:MAG: chemotaxis protein CheD [Nitrososphaera sp.]|uniref:chemotaxis protein CheD n=1 Tax=Nitrososphaera sp. TaxID=1971748 RepID=UPI0017FEABA1|nr:chemotaxis protein CheD [Nitrososphaera sp.]NWG37163.1 chemotaxis protein CheD [Nitrososphaera sp.]